MKRIATISIVLLGLALLSMREAPYYKEVKERLLLSKSYPQSDLAFMKFQVIPSPDLILLEWSIPSDVENPAVSVERSNDGKMWEEITEETSGMTLDQEMIFTHMDQVYESGVYYYRLSAKERQAKVFSNVRRVVIQSDREDEIVVAPEEEDYLKDVELPEDVKLDLYDFENNLIRSFKSKAFMDLKGLDPGLYIIRFGNDEDQPIVII